MLDEEQTNPTATTGSDAAAPKTPRRRGRASRPSGPPAPVITQPEVEAEAVVTESEPIAAKTPSRRRTTKKAAPASVDVATTEADSAAEPEAAAAAPALPRLAAPQVLFQAPDPTAAPPPRKRPARITTPDTPLLDSDDDEPGDTSDAGSEVDESSEPGTSASRNRRRRGRRGRGRGGAGAGENDEAQDGDDDASSPEASSDDSSEQSDDAGDGSDDSELNADGTRRRRRRRRRGGGGGGAGAATDDGDADGDDPPNTVVHVREPRPRASNNNRSGGGGGGGDVDDDGVRSVKGSTRLEAKRQRRRDVRDSGRRRPPVLTEAEFLARREAVERVMVIRQGDDRTQIGVLEDGVLVEHYVTNKDTSSMVGNVYLGKVQNVLPSMEAAFVDIGRGRNAVLYAGEVNYDASMLEGKPARIEQALKSGQSVLVQVTKDPIGHKGARLTSQVSIPGRYMVYVPDGRVSGISRKLPEGERSRLKSILKRLMPEDAGVIIRTAAEGASEADLERDLNRLHAQWEEIAKKAGTANSPSSIYGEPDLVIRVVRDIFNEDFASLVVQGRDEWDTVEEYLKWMAPDLIERSTRWTDEEDVFTAYRVDEQLAKGLDRKVWLPSGGYLVIDRTEAMVVIDVNTGKFTGKGGNLEQTVTKNNLEAAEEIVRQLRLRDLGGMIVIDFIDMVLESNRDLVLRRLTECLGRDRTRHQVSEVTSLGLVQLTRKRVGQGLTEAFSHVCKECGGSGIIIDHDPIPARRHAKAAKAARPAPPKHRVTADESAEEAEIEAEIEAETEADLEREVALAAGAAEVETTDVEVEVDEVDDAEAPDDAPDDAEAAVSAV